MTESKYKRITISFTESDSDIVEYLNELKGAGGASEFIREAIREKMNKGDTIIEDKVRSIIKEMLPNLISAQLPTEDKKSVEYQTTTKNTETNGSESINKAILDAIDSFDF